MGMGGESEVSFFKSALPVERNLSVVLIDNGLTNLLKVVLNQRL
jgi:hypothetical protein